MSESEKNLDDVCEFIVDCLHATAPVQEDGFPLIRTPNIGRGRLLLDGVYRVSEDTYDEWTRRAKPEADDLILAREAPAGNVAIVKNGQTVCLGQRTVHLRPDTRQVDPDFLCYYLLAPQQQGLLLAAETGATAKHVNMKDIRRLPLRNMPNIENQRRAGRFLATYDDIIEITGDGLPCWSRRRGCSTRNGSSTSASPATNTLQSSTAYRKDGRGRG